MGNSVILPRFIVYQVNHEMSFTHSYIINFELLLDNIPNRNPFVSIIIWDFNAKSKNWCSSDKTTYEVKKLKCLTFQCGIKQVISDTTLILESSSSSIDLIFMLQPNLVIKWRLFVTPLKLPSSIHFNNLTWKYSIHLYMKESSDIIKMQIMI